MLNKTPAFTARLKRFHRKKVAITSTGKLMQAIKNIKMRPIIAITNNPLLFILRHSREMYPVCGDNPNEKFQRKPGDT